MRHGALPALALLTLGLAILYGHIFHGEVAGDDLTFHMAESARIADCLRIGDFDFWNPSANAGFASAYYYQAVPQLASALPAAVFGHHVFFFQLSVFLPLVLAPAAAYRGMRLMGASPWQAAIAALALGLANGESRWGAGNAGTFVVGLYTQTWALAAFPLALGHAVRWATEGRGLAPAIAWGAFVTLCHPFAGVSLAVALIAGVIASLILTGVDWLLAVIGRHLHGDPAGGTWRALVAALGERWRNPPERSALAELIRLAILGACLAVVWAPIWLPLLIDHDGFGGFPHRVNDEVGPGFGTLFKWYALGSLLDFARPVVLTWTLPAVLLFARSRYLRWLWAPALLYALALGLGPHVPKTGDDLIPPVRFLGAMQVVLALGIGGGFLWLTRQLWDAPDGSLVARCTRGLVVGAIVTAAAVLAIVVGLLPDGARVLMVVHQMSLDRLSPLVARIVLIAALAAVAWGATVLLWFALRTQFGIRTALAALAAALFVLMTAQGARALRSRVNTLPDYPGSHGEELHTITWLLRGQPAGRKQVGPGAENHWWNLLSYEYGRRPSLLMMGGGGLQASPNYDYLWTVKDFKKNAWLFDAPILVFQTSSASSMPAGTKVLETGNFTVIRLPSPGLVSPVEITGMLPPGDKAHAAAIAWLKTDQPLKDRVLAYAGSAGPDLEPHGTVARAFRQDSPGDAPDMVAEVDATAPTTFMARESWHPRWRAFIDGAPAPIRRVTPDFPAVDVPAGHHTLTFRFDRPWWLHASWLAWPLLPLLAWLTTRRRRASKVAQHRTP